jgi:ABC-type branched-subunit amino acid transport system ATPase component
VANWRGGARWYGDFRRREYDQRTAYRQAVRGLRLVPQEGNVFPNLTVEDNLRLGALRLSGDASVQAARLEEVYATFPICTCQNNHRRK